MSATNGQWRAGGRFDDDRATIPRRADSFWFQRARIFEESDGQRGKPSSNAVAIQKLKKFVAYTRVVTEYLFYDALKSGKISLGEKIKVDKKIFLSGLADLESIVTIKINT